MAYTTHRKGFEARFTCTACEINKMKDEGMKCVKIQEIISAYVDTEACALEQLALLEHMKGCPICKNELANQYAIKLMTEDYTKSAPDIDISARVMARIATPVPETTENSGTLFITKYSKWMVAAFIMMLTVAALYSARINTADTASASPANPAKEYAEYIYEHISDAGSYANTSSPAYSGQVQQVSLIK